MSGTVRSQREAFRRALVASLLTGASKSPSTLAFVDERMARLEGVARISVLGVESLLSAMFALATAPAGDRNTSSTQPSSSSIVEVNMPAATKRAERLLRRLDATQLPGVADYVRLVRTLTLVAHFECHLNVGGLPGP
jgi:hypothetical protein